MPRGDAIVPRVNAAGADEGFLSDGGYIRLILKQGTTDIRFGEVCHGGGGVVGSPRYEGGGPERRG